MLDYTLLPKKLNDICAFVKKEKGSVMLSYSQEASKRDNIILTRFEDFEIEKDFIVSKNALEMAKKLEAEEIKITDKSFIVKSSKGRYTTKLIQDNVPNVHLPKEKKIKLDLKYLSKASSYVASNNSRPVLTGVYCDSKGNIIATDSYKAYLYRNEEEANLEEETISVSIPNSFIKTVCDNYGQEICNATFDKQTIAIVQNETVIVGNLLAGEYPDISRIIATVENKKKLPLDINSMIECVNITKSCDSGDNVCVKLTKNHFQSIGESEFESDINFALNDDEVVIMLVNNFQTALNTLKAEENVNVQIAFNDKKFANLIYLTTQSEKVLVLGYRQQ